MCKTGQPLTLLYATAYLTPLLIFGLVISHTLKSCRFVPLAGEKFCSANEIAPPKEWLKTIPTPATAANP